MQYEYEWDHNKARSNLRKHSIQFADAVSVFNDNFAITISDDHPDEERFIIEPIWYLKKQLTFVIRVGESKDGFWWWHEPKYVQNFSLKTCIAPSKHYFFQPPTLF